MNLLMNGNFYIVISIGTFACYLFLSSCFISIPRDEKVIRYLRMILTALLCWTMGSMLMRLQISPGAAFWYQFSMLGLFIIPIAVYGFLFCVLEITGKTKLLNVCMLLTLAVFILNAFTGCLLPVPEMQVLPDGTISYVYHPRGGMWLWIAAEIVLLVYVTVLAHNKSGHVMNTAVSWVPCFWESCCSLQEMSAVFCHGAKIYPWMHLAVYAWQSALFM